MVNRTIQQKILKMKRRSRFAKLSGSPSRYKTRVIERLEPVVNPDGSINEDSTMIKQHHVLVGEVSLSRQVVNTGRGPDKERMQEYYQRLHSFDESLPATIGAVSIDQIATGRRTESGLRLKDLENTYNTFIKGVPKELRINYLNDEFARLDLFFAGTQWFWVEIDFKKKFCRRSKIYPNKKMADLMLTLDKITWVETISPH